MADEKPPAVVSAPPTRGRRLLAHVTQNRWRYLVLVVSLIGVIAVATTVPLVLGDKRVPAAKLQEKPTDLAMPVQQRIAIKGPNSIAVAWNTFKKVNRPCVQYGTSPDKLHMEACSSDSTTYPTSRTWANKVTLPNLSPATTYYYYLGGTNTSVQQFLSPRLPGDKTPFTLNAVADLGVYGEAGYTIRMDKSQRSNIPFIPPSMNHTTIARLTETLDDYEFVIHPGDLAYADDWDFKNEKVFQGKNAFQAILETFYDQLAPVAGRKPYMVSPGNHEAACKETFRMTHKCPNGQKNFTDFMHRFSDIMPTTLNSTSSDNSARVHANVAKELANPPFWYSFEYGMVHITMIDTETDFPNAPDEPGGYSGLDSGPFGAPSQQIKFLEADLASVDRSVTPWVIVAGHRPWYARGGHGHDGFRCEPCQAAFEKIFYRYGVDIGVFGHVHNSQRFMPTYNNTVDPAGMKNPKAPMYIVAGGAGSVEGLSPLGANITSNAWGDAEHFAYATLKIQDANNLKIEFIRSSNGQILDSSTLYKEHKERFVLQS